jgi:hypothetical protein
MSVGRVVVGVLIIVVIVGALISSVDSSKPATDRHFKTGLHERNGRDKWNFTSGSVAVRLIARALYPSRPFGRSLTTPQATTSRPRKLARSETFPCSVVVKRTFEATEPRKIRRIEPALVSLRGTVHSV